ncbi:hypothetical protein [Streptomyces sp. NBC_01314]|uniref:hypothetical protein n=1 Tax=Streptomyces sp. NBC_01314 TaxID=2903821 RepID=UPI0030913B5D|nr:hypothetical protein OG622_20205 [Streptomyces sp. NBC_01314]
MPTPPPKDDGPPPPIEISPSVTANLDYVLNIMAWLVTAAGVAGLLIVGIRMAIAVRNGDRDEHVREFLMVMSACVLGATAGPVVSYLLNG